MKNIIKTFFLVCAHCTFAQITDTGDKVGIGTTNPQKKLHINATADDGIALASNNAILGDNGSGVFTQLLFWNGTNTYYGRSLAGGSVSNHYFRTGGTDRMTINSTGNVGIGTTNPKAVLDVGGYIHNEALGTVFGRLFEGNTSGDGTYLGVKGYGTQNTEFDGKSFSIVHNFYGTTNSSVNFFRGGGITGGFLTFNTNNNTEGMRLDANGNLGIGTTNTKGFKLGVQGKIAAEEVKVAVYANWADFVFEDNYNLPTLKEVEQHIKDKGHLKDIPSAEEVKANGIFLGDMDSKLLQKIEELTLYTIEQQKQIEGLKRQNSQIKELKKENEVLKTLLERVITLEEKIKL